MKPPGPLHLPPGGTRTQPTWQHSQRGGAAQSELSESGPLSGAGGSRGRLRDLLILREGKGSLRFSTAVEGREMKDKELKGRGVPGRGYRVGLLTSHSVLAVCCGPPIDTLAPAEVPMQPRAEGGQGEQDQQESQGHGSPSGLFSAWSGPSNYPGRGRHCGSRSRGLLTRTGTSSWVALPTGHLSLCPGPTIASRSHSHQRDRGHR